MPGRMKWRAILKLSRTMRVRMKRVRRLIQPMELSHLPCVGMDIDEVIPAMEDSEEKPAPPRAYVPGLHTLEKDEVLEADESTYIMRHTMNVNWPCLSFDILRDSLGDERRRFPATAYIVSGTQADEMKKNEITVYKMSSLHKTQKDGGE